MLNFKLFKYPLILGIILFISIIILYQKYNNIDILLPMKEFPEPPWRTPSTLDAKTIVSTPFARFEIHKVKTESGEIINDWLWTDERSHVNILVIFL